MLEWGAWTGEGLNGGGIKPHNWMGRMINGGGDKTWMGGGNQRRGGQNVDWGGGGSTEGGQHTCLTSSSFSLSAVHPGTAYPIIESLTKTCLNFAIWRIPSLHTSISSSDEKKELNSETWGEWGVTYGENGYIFEKPERYDHSDRLGVSQSG